MIFDLLADSNLENFVIFRHGKAERPYDAPDDFSRNLVERGKKDATNQALRLKEGGFFPDKALVSSANRAAQTWEMVSELFPECPAEITRDLYLASPKIYLEKAINDGAKNIILIAHDPGLHDLCRHFLKSNVDTMDAHLLMSDLPTAGVAWFQKNNKDKGQMRLISHLRPIKTAD